jgi:hypothetical protein
VIERVSPHRMRLQLGDVGLSRELLRRVNPRPISTEPQWRYRVCIEGERRSSQWYQNLIPASAYAEELATRLGKRLMFVEDGVVSLLADYRAV